MISPRRPPLPRAFALFLALLWLPACGSHAGAQPHTYYVDFDRGSDQAAGQSEDQPWKHAPGDPQAQGGPKRMVLGPGDKVLFRGGVTYRGAIQLENGGAAGQPITYAGEGFGPGKAILSGRDVVRVQVRPCEAAPGCAGLAGAADLRVIDLPAPIKPSDQVTVDGQLLSLAQSPDLPDAFWYDDLKHYQKASRSSLTGGAGRWRLQSNFIRANLGQAPMDDLVVHVWGQPNAVTSARAEGYDPVSSTVSLLGDIQPYDDRDTLFALVNHPALIRRPYQFATLDHGARLVVKAPLALGEAQVEVSRRGAAFTLAGGEHVVMEGFDIQGYTGADNQDAGGVALLSNGATAQDVTFRRNYVHDLTSWAGAGALQVSNITGLSVTDNRFHRLWRGAGVILGGKNRDVRILRNDFDHIGRTGILVVRARNVWIDRNRMTGMLAHHGNGISVYLDNQDVLVSNNLIRDTVRAITFEGSGQPNAEPNRIVIRRNLIQVSGEGGLAVQSWGGPTLGVTIEGNVLLSDNDYSLGLIAGDRGVVVRRNVTGAMRYDGAPADWVVQDNIFMGDSYVASGDTLDAWSKRNKFVLSPSREAKAIVAAAPTAAPKICAALLGDNAPPQGLDWLGAADLATLSKGVGPDSLCAP